MGKELQYRGQITRQAETIRKLSARNAELESSSTMVAIRDVLSSELKKDYDQLKAEGDLLRHQLAACAKELRKVSTWICREVEAGTASATHWVVRLKTNADQIDAAIGKESSHE